MDNKLLSVVIKNKFQILTPFPYFHVKVNANMILKSGLNVWRLALVREINDCKGMNIAIVKNHRKSTPRTRDGKV